MSKLIDENTKLTNRKYLAVVKFSVLAVLEEEVPKEFAIPSEESLHLQFVANALPQMKNYDFMGIEVTDFEVVEEDAGEGESNVN